METPGTKASEMLISMALITRLNKPRLIRLNGRLISSRIGFKIRLTRNTVRLIINNAGQFSIWIESEKSVIIKMLSMITINCDNNFFMIFSWPSEL
jgi:hypothetical protein